MFRGGTIICVIIVILYQYYQKETRPLLKIYFTKNKRLKTEIDLSTFVEVCSY